MMSVCPWPKGQHGITVLLYRNLWMFYDPSIVDEASLELKLFIDTKQDEMQSVYQLISYLA